MKLSNQNKNRKSKKNCKFDKILKHQQNQKNFNPIHLTIPYTFKNRIDKNLLNNNKIEKKLSPFILP